MKETTPVNLLCGHRAYLEPWSGMGSYRCEACMAVVFSIAMPRVCKELYDKQKTWEILSK